MKRIALLSSLATILLVGAGCVSQPISTPSTDWLTYQSDELAFSASYPSDLAPTVTGNSVSFNPTDGGMWGYSIRATSTAAKNVDEWASGQSPAVTRFLSVATGSEQRTEVMARSVPVDADNGRPIYATMLEAVIVQNGTAYVISWPNQAPAGTPPWMSADTMRFIQSVMVDVPEPSAEDQAWHEANKSLAQFLGLLHEKTYAAAAVKYGGDLSQLREWNPTVDPNDVAMLWKNGCEMNGLLCMEVGLITPVSHEGDAWTFSVAFTANDGKPYAKDGKTEFPFVVRAGNDGLYYVETMPLYQE